MLAVDSNVIIRYLTNDDPVQSAKAQLHFGREPVFIATTVLLETEWVLRAFYQIAGDQIAKSLRKICGLEQITLEDTELTDLAISWFEAGMDFADAVHLATAEGCEAFITFDKKLVRAARKIVATPVRQL